MAETTVPMDDQALFNAATSEAAPETPAVETQAAVTEQQPQDAGPARDEHGRFAPKAAEAEATTKAETTEQQPQAAQTAQHEGIPTWRLREEAEARRAAETRLAQLEAQNRQFQQQLRQFTEKPAAKPDMFENPDGFVEHGVRQALDPVQRQMAETREYFSRKDAIRTHGMETVQAAYKWLETAANARDPRVGPLLERVTQSIDPFEDVVTAYKRDRALSTVGDDPNAWFEKELARRKAEDPQFAAQFAAQPQQQDQQGTPATNIVVKLPPSLNRQPGAAQAPSLGASDTDLYAYATR